MPKVVIIHADTSLDEFAEQIQRSIDRRFHNYDLTPECRAMGKHTSEAQRGQIESTSAHASHQIEVEVDAHGHAWYNGRDLGHVERLIR